MRQHGRVIGVSLVLAIVLSGVFIYNNAPYGDARDGRFTDRGLDLYFARSGHNGQSWASAYIFDGITYDRPDVLNTLSFDHTTRYVIIKNCVFINASGFDGVLGAAIKLSHCRNFRIENCRFVNCDAGILIEYSQDFEILNSHFQEIVGVGVQLSHVHQDIVKNNTFQQCGQGINISIGSHHTTLVFNNFTSNQIHAIDSSENQCLWSLDGLGNYWDNYLVKCPAANLTHNDARLEALIDPAVGGVFLGSDPYPINWGVSDKYPLIYLPKQLPEINVTAPSRGSVWGENSPAFDIRITGFLVTDAWYCIAGISGVFTIGSSGDFPIMGTKAFTGTLDETPWDNLTSGQIIVEFHAATWFGVENITEVVIVKDILPPIITILMPTVGTPYGSVPPPFSLSIAEDHLVSVWYTCNSGDATVTITELDGFISPFMWSVSGDGIAFIHFYASDSTGNIGTATVQLTKDTLPPNLFISAPIPNEVYGNASFEFHFNASDPQLVSAYVGITGQSPSVQFGSEGSYTALFPVINWASQPDGIVDLVFGAVDILGNVQEQNIVVNKDSTPPLPSFSFLHSNVAGELPPEIAWRADDANAIDRVWYIFGDNTTTHEVQLNAFTLTLDAIAWGQLGDGRIKVHLFARDICSNIGSITKIIVKDTSAPILHILDPVSGSIYGLMPPTFTIRVLDPTISTLVYRINGSLQACSVVLDPGHEQDLLVQFDSIWWSLLTSGDYIITFDASDLLQHHSLDSVLIKKDILPPSLVILLPLTGASVTATPPGFHVLASDSSYVHRVWYSLDGGSTITFLPLNSFEGFFASDKWGAVFNPGQNLTIVFWANDTLGNVACTSIIVKSEDSVFDPWDLFHGPGLFGFLLLVAIGFLGVIIILEVKYHHRASSRRGPL